MENLIQSLTLKLCLAVLLLLVGMPLLDPVVTDTSMEQGLHQLDRLAVHPSFQLPANNSTGLVLDVELLCKFLRTYESKIWMYQKSRLMVMVLANYVLWSQDPSSCPCCPKGNQSAARVSSPVRVAGKAMLRAEFDWKQEPAEFTVLCQPPEDCRNSRSVALFDKKHSERSLALQSFLFTLAVVLLMLVFVIYFAMDMKKLANNYILHPLFDLIDDMCAMKCMEVVAENDSKEAPTVASVLKDKHKFASCKKKFFQPIPVAEELVQLRTSFDKLKGAMRSWTKYVPGILFRQLFEAGIEAQIGCTRSDVTIIFCDVQNFEALCKNMGPQDVLGILEVVLENIGSVLKDYGGTLLEFIGDEVLAVFNAPAEVLNHTQSAVSAAVEIMERVSQIKGYASEVRLQLGVHRASVLAGNLGSPTRMKYGVLGDGVNMTARLKSLNSRYKTTMLCSDTALEFEGAKEFFVTRPIGNLILKGRTVPTNTFEVLGRRAYLPDAKVNGAEAHTRGFDLFQQRQWEDAKCYFEEAQSRLSRLDATPENGVGSATADGPSTHHIRLCEEYLKNPPPVDWDGSEILAKKAW